MTEQEQNIAIAEACGWKDFHKESFFGRVLDAATCPKKQCTQAVQNYTRDLNAMHEAEKVLTDTQANDQWSKYCVELNRICCRIPCGNNPLCGYTIHATAAQRAEAFLRTLNKWTDSPEQRKEQNEQS